MQHFIGVEIHLSPKPPLNLQTSASPMLKIKMENYNELPNTNIHP